MGGRHGSSTSPLVPCSLAVLNDYSDYNALKAVNRAFRALSEKEEVCDATYKTGPYGMSLVHARRLRRRA